MLTESHPNPNQVIVSAEDQAFAPARGICARHRDFPELRADGETARDAAELLVRRLTWALDNAGGDWRRSQLEAAIEDIKAFVDRER